MSPRGALTREERQAVELKTRLDTECAGIFRRELEHQDDAAAARVLAVCDVAFRELSAILVPVFMAIHRRLDKLEGEER